MKYYFAPMEGITGYIYRNAHHKFFGHADRYFTPFLSPNQNKTFTSKEKNDVLPEHNQGLQVIPQILTNRAGDFIWAAKELQKYGYEEVNLNLGCPSRTVVSKHKGSGFLAWQKELDQFLETVFAELNMKISIKTRIGKDSPKEFYELIHIYNKYPLSELIIHPRLQTDYYRNTPNMTVFRDALSMSKNTICYNGDLFRRDDFNQFAAAYPMVDRVMFGRGLVADPCMIEKIGLGKQLDKRTLRGFHDAVYQGYQEVTSGDRNVLFKMKELWFYMETLFLENGKYLKKIKKSEKCCTYENAVDELFLSCEFADRINEN